ncbi:hypothetical protein EG028_08435 [Chitinophaga barathri]|uniref:Uncharacterized protein n=1 Tax=Chitinophaga barathri TaxID=1647451 RepID=A0A3N4MRF0_9BACT|nr:hypothetical protein EG028_08435 [Chitinophaga barathri]
MTWGIQLRGNLCPVVKKPPYFAASFLSLTSIHLLYLIIFSLKLYLHHRFFTSKHTSPHLRINY